LEIKRKAVDPGSDSGNMQRQSRGTRTPKTSAVGITVMGGSNPRATAITRSRYNRIAPFYDIMETLAERRYHPWRQRFWKHVDVLLPMGGELLEVGVGTGKNIPYWPTKAHITAIDVTPAMLQRARTRAAQLGVDVDLKLGDAQALIFRDDEFDLAAATFVFCSVPDPVLGLKELTRVVRSGGFIVLMEHVRATQPVLGALMDTFNPFVVRLIGANINRDTVTNVRAGGLIVTNVEDLDMTGIFKLIVAQVQKDPKNPN